MVMRSPTLLLFLKAPRSGKVKTRLAADIGDAAAVEVYRQLVEKQILHLPSHWQLRILFDPPEAELEMKDWLGDAHDYAPQSPGDLGDRLREGVKQAFHDGAEQVFCIGADCSGLYGESFLKALQMLQADADLVVGPAEDGGYVLLGMNHPYLALFEDIPWSQPTTLEVTLQRAAELHLRVGRLKTRFDIDTLHDLERAIQCGWLTYNLNSGVLT
jgi:rSAM/selenodomain-associated transferase 1